MFKNFLRAVALSLVLTLSIPAQALSLVNPETYFNADAQTIGGDIVSVDPGETVQALQVDISTTADHRTMVPQYALIETFNIKVTKGAANELAKITNLTLKELDGDIVSSLDVTQQSANYTVKVERAVDMHKIHNFNLYATFADTNSPSSNAIFQLYDVKIRTADGLNYPPYVNNHSYVNFSTANSVTEYTAQVSRSAHYDETAYREFTYGQGVRVHTVGIKPQQDSVLKSISFEVKGDLSAYVDTVKVPFPYMNSQMKVPTLTDGKYKITFDESLTKDVETLFHFYISASKAPSAGKTIQGYIKVTNVEMVLNDTDNRVVVSGLPVESATISLKGPAVVATNYTVKAYKDSIDDYFTTETFYNAADVPVHTVRFTVPQGTKLKTLTAKVTGDLANYVSNLKAAQNGDSTTQMKVAQLSNGEYKFTFNSDLITNGVNFVDIYLDPSKSPASGTSVTGYVSVTAAEFTPNTSTNTVSVTGLPSASYKLTLKSGTKTNTVPTREYEEPLPNSQNPFSDITTSQLNSLEARAAIALEAQGIIGGYLVNTNGPVVEFRGYNNVNRAEAAKFLVNSLGLDESQFCDYSVAPDVEEGKWYTKYVCTANKYDIMVGGDDGFFRPGDWVNTAEFAKMIFKAHSLTDYPGYTAQSGDIWYRRYGLAAQHHNIFPSQDGRVEPSHYLTRFEVAVAIYTVLDLQ